MSSSRKYEMQSTGIKNSFVSRGNHIQPRSVSLNQTTFLAPEFEERANITNWGGMAHTINIRPPRPGYLAHSLLSPTTSFFSSILALPPSVRGVEMGWAEDNALCLHSATQIRCYVDRGPTD